MSRSIYYDEIGSFWAIYMDPAKPNQSVSGNTTPMTNSLGDASSPFPSENQRPQLTTEEVPSTPLSNISEVSSTPELPSSSTPPPAETPVFQNITEEPQTVTAPPPSQPSSPLQDNKRKIIFGALSGLLLVGGTVAGVILVRQQQNIEEKAATYSPIACPIAPAQNRVIVNFDGNFIRSDQDESKAKQGPITTYVPKGTYKVTLVSYEKDHPQSATQPKETWFVKLNNSQGSSFAQTNAIGDMADSESIKQEVVESSFNVSQDVGSILAYHGAYSDKSSPNSINPVCAVFEKVEEVVDVQCTGVTAYDEDWNALSSSDLQKLKAGDTVRFAVQGTSTSGSIDKAKFTINGTERSEVTNKKPGSNEFYDEYTIPTGTKSFTVTAKVHHASKNTWH